ncbi:MAG TPA: hypothetical protein VHM91_12700 [Verrucomicrobiales bacterium]|jgi:hypothetical protein|nr:hypothetical protein [Verrucomicrobiales bacterium]
MPRPAIIALRILAVGSALTILACQIANRQKQAQDAGDRSVPGSGASAEKKAMRPEDYWAASSKSGPMVRPDQLKKTPAAPAPVQTASPAPPPENSIPMGEPLPPMAPSKMPTHTRGFGSKSAPLVTPSDLRQLQQSTQQSRP